MLLLDFLNMTSRKKIKAPISKLTDEQQQALDTFKPMWTVGARLGCTQDQLQNFTRANLLLQPKQLEFAAK